MHGSYPQAESKIKVAQTLCETNVPTKCLFSFFFIKGIISKFLFLSFLLVQISLPDRYPIIVNSFLEKACKSKYISFKQLRDFLRSVLLRGDNFVIA